jgi:predicted HicB family RNase H-like nuclease
MARRHAANDDVEDEVLVNLNARVPRNLWRRVRLQCLRQGRLLRTFITEALEERLRTEKRRRG